MKFDAKKIIEKFTTEDVIDFDKINKAVLGQVQTHTDAIVKDSIGKTEKEFFTNLGIKDITNVDGLKSHLTNATGSEDEYKTKITKLENDLGEAKKFEEKYNVLNVELAGNKNKSFLTTLGINPAQSGNAMAIIRNNVNETTNFEVAAKAFADDKSNSWAIDNSASNVSGPAKIPGAKKEDAISSYDKIMKEKYGITRD